MELTIWKDLTPNETKEFIEWTLDNWKPDTPAKQIWHPLIRKTWEKLDEAFAITKREIRFDYNDLVKTEHN